MNRELKLHTSKNRIKLNIPFFNHISCLSAKYRMNLLNSIGYFQSWNFQGKNVFDIYLYFRGVPVISFKATTWRSAYVVCFKQRFLTPFCVKDTYFIINFRICVKRGNKFNFYMLESRMEWKEIINFKINKEKNSIR